MKRLLFVLLISLSACHHETPHAAKPIDYQGVTTPHSMKALHEGKFAAIFDRDVKLDPGLGPNTTRLRTYFVCLFASYATGIPGDFASVGISYGVAPHTIYDFTDFASTGKKYHFIDPFTGTSEDGTILAKYNKDVDAVLSHYPKNAPIVIHRALVPDNLPIKVGKLAFVHLNTGAFPHEARSLKFFWDHLSPGGIMVIDGYAISPGHQDVYDPALKKIGADIFTLPTGQGVVFKPLHIKS